MNKQFIQNQEEYLSIDIYISEKGLRLIKEGMLTKEQADKKYGRNRYGLNENAKPIRTIVHVLQPFKR